jgi:hypothetical protein
MPRDIGADLSPGMSIEAVSQRGFFVSATMNRVPGRFRRSGTVRSVRICDIAGTAVCDIGQRRAPGLDRDNGQ